MSNGQKVKSGGQVSEYCQNTEIVSTKFYCCGHKAITLERLHKHNFNFSKISSETLIVHSKLTFDKPILR